MRHDVETFRHNYASLYQQATPAEKASGLAWYREAQDYARMLADASGRSLANIAALIAVLSPQCSWSVNRLAAFDMLDIGSTSRNGPLPLNVLKAQRVLAEWVTNTRHVMPTGNKVEAFASNIAGNMDAVTIDTHMTEAAHCSPERRPFSKDAAYKAYALAVRLVADEVGESPALVQAVIWTVWKRLHAPGQKRAHRLGYVVKR